MNTQKPTLRRLGQDDTESLISYLESDRHNNLFHLSNLDQLSFDHPDLRYFGAFQPDGDWAGELMLFRTSAGVYWQDRRVLPYFKDIILREKARAISGQKDQVNPLLNLLPDGVISERISATYAVVGNDDLLPWAERGERPATLDDCDLLADLYARNLLFGKLDWDKHRARIESVLTTGGIITLIERDGLAVSAARTSAIGHGMAMIGGVITLPAYRQMGLARACTGLLSRQLIERGLDSCLTYNSADPAASRTYLGLGYRTIDEWTIAFLEP